MKPVFLGMIILVLLISTAAEVEFIHPVLGGFVLPPWPQIHIEADGDVSPQNSKVVRIDNIYTFTDNIFNFSIMVERSDVLLDGSGFSLSSGGGTPDSGITVMNVTNVSIRNVKIDNFVEGIAISNSYNNTITEVTVTRSSYCIDLYHNSGNNLIYDNNFIDPDIQPAFLLYSGANIWDHNSQGNYWSNYNGTDNNGDKIGDTPYVLNSNNVDYYPLMNRVNVQGSPAPSPSPTIPVQTPNPSFSPGPNGTSGFTPEETGLPVENPLVPLQPLLLLIGVIAAITVALLYILILRKRVNSFRRRG
jgi:hypothetical protein